MEVEEPIQAKRRYQRNGIKVSSTVIHDLNRWQRKVNVEARGVSELTTDCIDEGAFHFMPLNMGVIGVIFIGYANLSALEPCNISVL
jgi:hypothetical protein